MVDVWIGLLLERILVLILLVVILILLITTEIVRLERYLPLRGKAKGLQLLF